MTAELAIAPSAEFERTPPQALEAEMSVLGGMLLSKDAIADVIEIIRTGDFYRPAHQTVFDAIVDLYGRGDPADAVTVMAELTRQGELARVGGGPYLHSLVASVPTAASAGFYARIVRDAAVLRRLVEAGTRIVQLGYAGKGGDVDDLVDRAQQAIFEVTERRTSEDYVALAELLQPTLVEIEAIGARDGTMHGVPTGFADLDTLTNGLHGGQLVILAARPAIGKALALDTPLPTPSGWTTMGEVAVGDFLLGADGRPTRVTAATGVMTGRDCFELAFSDGTTIVADADHQWLTRTRASRRIKERGTVCTTAEIARSVRCPTADGRANHSIDVAAALDLPEVDLPITPYVLGVWLGDGHSAAARFTSADPEIPMYVEADGYVSRQVSPMLYSIQLPAPEPVEPRSCTVCAAPFIPATSQVRTCGRTCGGRVRGIGTAVPPTCADCGGPSCGLVRCQRCRNAHGTVAALLRTLGVLGNKHIPRAYLRASERQRRELLAGLLDTDGTVTPQGSVQFTVTNRRLADAALELVLSLGYRCAITSRSVRGRSAATSIAYSLNFTTSDEVFRLERKRVTHKERRGPGTRASARFIVSARQVETVPVRCVQVDNDDHLYLAGRTMVPTHNSTLGLDLARAASIKHSLASVIFSLEMSKHEITMRLLSAEARVSLQSLRTGKMTDDDWTRLARRMGEVADAPLFIDDSPNLTMMEIRAKARRLKQRNDLRLVVVDYMQLMSSPKRVENRQQEVSEISRSLKLLAKELDVPVVAISQLNRSPEQRADKKPQLSDLRESGCLTADTRVMRADTNAEVTFGELFETGERNIPVWTLDEDLHMVRGTMTHVFSSGVKETFELRLRSGRRVEASANHPFLTYEGWARLDELVAGSRIAIPRAIDAPTATAPWPNHEVVMLAHLLGDGCFAPRQPVHYTTTDSANLDAVAEAAEHFGITPRLVPQQNWWHLYLPSPYRLTHGRHNPIVAWLDRFGLRNKRSYEKFVPREVFALPREQVALFLRHIWATDGSMTISKGSPRVYYASTSRRLVDDLQTLLLRFGIVGRVKTAKKAGYRDSFHLHIYGGDHQLRFVEEIGAHGARGDIADEMLALLRSRAINTNVDTIPVQVWDEIRASMVTGGVTARALAEGLEMSYCGSALYKSAPSRPRLERVAKVLDDDNLRRLARSDVFWDEVAAITPLGPQPVYDATVLETHNFIANGIVAENSLEQDADMVILLYREDAFEKESPRAGEADFIVAKHRNGPTATVTVAFQGHYSRFVDMTPNG